MKLSPIISRTVLAVSISLAFASTFVAVAPAQAAAPMQHKQVAGFYRTMIGDYEVTALHDGSGSIDSNLLQGDPALIQSLLARSFQNDPKNVSATVQGYLVNTGSKLILIDTGACGHWGPPELGKLVQNLKVSGYKPEQVDVVLMTHLHADHVGGIYKDGKRVFPNATVMMQKADANFWLSKEIAAKAPEDAKIFFKIPQDGRRALHRRRQMEAVRRHERNRLWHRTVCHSRPYARSHRLHDFLEGSVGAGLG